MADAVVLYGSSGRIGNSIMRQLVEVPIRAKTPSKDSALMEVVQQLSHVNKLIIIFAIPHQAMEERLLELEACQGLLSVAAIIVIDCSGHVKLNIPDHWHILGNQSWKNYFETHKGPIYYVGNPGCMASAVIQGIRASYLSWVGSDISITAVGGKSFAPTSPSEYNALRTAKRWTSHHHVKEIERVFREERISVSSFVPIVSGDLENGLLVVVSGQAKRTELNVPTRPHACVNATRDVIQTVADGSELTLSDIIGMPTIKIRVDAIERQSGTPAVVNVSIAIGLDNVEYIGYLAVSTVLIVAAT